MATRNIKDAKDLTTNELIYFKGHAQATYMSDGTTVEDAINGIETGGSNIDLSEYATKEELNDKQNVINDLDTIRNGAALGATALQTETYKGTITGVSANGTSIATSGVANIPAASTSAYGVTKLSSSTSSTSTTLAATSSAVKAAYDLANSKQATLVSGTNIKTINGTSLLGSGNIVISGGGGDSGGSGAYSEVSHGTSDTTFALTPNTFHIWDEVASLTLTLGDETAGVANEFLFQFNSGSTATTLTLPDTIKWANDSAPTIESNMIYQVSILKGLASVLEFKNIVRISFTVGGVSYQAEEGMTWEQWVNSEYNTSTYFISGSSVLNGVGNYVQLNGYNVVSTDVVISDSYTSAAPGGQ